MADITDYVNIDGLPPADNIFGAEMMEVLQAGVNRRATAEQVLQPLKDDLADPEKGGALVADVLRVIPTANDLRATIARYNGDRVHLTSYHDGWASTTDGPEGGGNFVWVPQRTDADNGGTVFEVSGETGRWIRELAGADLQVEWFGAKGDGATDDFPSINSCIALCREKNIKGLFKAKPYYIAGGTIDISGVTLEGIYRGHRNVAGTRLIGNKTATVLRQENLGTPNQYFDLKNLRVEGAVVGLDIRYGLYSRLTNIDIFEPTGDGFLLGDENIQAGPLGVYADRVNIWKSGGKAFKMRGSQYNNSNVLFRCWFETANPLESCVDIDIVGGYGSLSTRFVKCQTAGVGAGFTIRRAFGLVLDQIYMENNGPAIRITGLAQVEVRSPIFGSMRNDNSFDEPNIIQHSGSGSARLYITNPYITLGSGPEQANLSLFGSTNPSSFYVGMDGQVTYGAQGSGFSLFRDNILQSNVNMSERTTFATEWRATTVNPTIGNGTLTMDVDRQGTQVTVNVRLVIGSTTELGTGGWTFTLPYLSRMVGSAQGYALKGTTRHPVLGSISGRVLSLWLPGTASPISPTQPFSWEAGNSLVVTLTYQI